MRLALLVIAALLVVLFFSLKSRASCRVVMIGDSQASRLQQLGVLSSALGKDYELRSFAVPGSSLLSWALGKHDRELRCALASLRSGDVLLVVLGTNDCCMRSYVLRNEPPYLQALLHRFGNARVVWVVPPKLRRRCQENIKPFVSMLRAARVDMIDTQRVEIDMWNDGIHASDQGRLVWARFIAEELRVRMPSGVGLQEDWP